MRKLFWLVLAVVIAFTVHVAYILFVPSHNFAQGMDVALGKAGSNAFVIPSPQLQSRLLPFTTSGDLVGLCKFNVTEGPVHVSMAVPTGYWTFAIYTMRGRQIYALNDSQAEGQSFTVTLTHRGGLLSQIAGLTEDDADAVEGDLGWSVELDDYEGLAVFWMPMADPVQRNLLLQTLRRSQCTLRKV